MEKGFFALCRLLTICGLFSVSFNVVAQKLESVDFIQDGEVSKLILDFDREVFAERKHIPDDKQIILDVKNTSATKRQLRGIDTSEFSGSVVFVSGYQRPGSENDLRFAIQLRDNVRSTLDRKGKRLILNIENRFGVFSKKTMDKSKVNEELDGAMIGNQEKVNIPKSDSIEDILENLTLSGVKRYVGKKISIRVKDLPFPDLLRMIADTSGFNIIIDDGVKALPNVTLNLTNIPWDQALDTVLDLGQLVALRHANILTVKTKAKALAERERELEQKSKNKVKEPLVTKILPLSFADQTELIDILKDYITPKRGSIKADKRTNNLIIQDTVDVIERMKSIVKVLDRETPQVLIESKIVEATEDYQLNLGLASTSDEQGIGFSYDAFGGNSPTSGVFAFNSATNIANPVAVSASIISGKVDNLNFRLNLMESEQKVRIVSSPRIITKNNLAATIQTRNSQYFRVASSSIGDDGSATTTNTLTEVSADINLTVTPQVTNDGSISMQVEVTKSDFGEEAVEGSGLPNVIENTVNTNVLVDNGSTVVIGGLYKSKTTEAQSGVPFLKDLPIIGWLFKSSYNPKKSKTELVVFLTPRIINQEAAGFNQSEIGDTGIQ